MMDVDRTLPLVMSIDLRQLLVPVGTTGLYYTPYVTTAIVSQVAVPAAVLGAALIGLVYWDRRAGDSIVAFGAFWLVVGVRPPPAVRKFRQGPFAPHPLHLFPPNRAR